MIESGRTIVRTPGKPVPLSIIPKQVLRLSIYALTDNSDVIAVGDKKVSEVSGNENGMPLDAKDIAVFEDEDMNQIFIDAGTANQGVRWLAVT